MMQNVLTQRNVTYCSWRCDDGATVIAEGIGNLQYLLDHVDAVLHGCPAAGRQPYGVHYNNDAS